MAASGSKTNRDKIIFGSLMGVAGLYFVFVGAGTLPPPGGPENMHAPPAVVVCIGMVLLLGGLSLVIQGFARSNDQGELPAGAPPWLRAAHHFIGVGIFVSFALIGSWIAVAGEPGQFSGGGVAVGGGHRLTVARAAFGFGAAICWAVAIGLTVSGLRRLRRRRRAESASAD